MGAIPHVPEAVPAARPRRRLLRRWVVAVMLGELAGFAVPTVVGGVAWALEPSPGVLYAVLVCAGACEGAVLAGAQWIVLRNPLPRLPARAWILATAAAAALAWSLGMLPSTLGDRLEDVPLALLVPVSVAGGAVLLLSIGVAQSLVLRRHVVRAWRWVGANVLAWCLGLVVSVSFMSILLTEDTTLGAAVGIGVTAGLLMGLTVALVTGWFLVRILDPR